jgi:phosphoglycerate dehydrogenase-like enzyme
VKKAEALGITICRAEGANAEGVAELAFGLILSAARGLHAAESALKDGGWTRSKGRELEGKTLGLVGCGRIGKLVAQFALAFGMDVLAHDAFPDLGFRPSGRFAFAPLDRLLHAADYLSLHCPPLPGGSPLLDGPALARVKPGVVLVNSARESLVDRAALLAALDAGTVSVYAIAAFDQEPPEDWSLIRHPRVLATPHIGGFTAESIDRATAVAVDNLLAHLPGTKR